MLLHACRRLLDASVGSSSQALLKPCATVLCQASGSASGTHLQQQQAWLGFSWHSAFTTTSTSAAAPPEPSTPLDPASGPPPPDAPSPASSSDPSPTFRPSRFALGARRVSAYDHSAAASGLHGVVHIFDATSNIILTFTDAAGRVLAWSSGGSVRKPGDDSKTPMFRNARKGLPVAAERAAAELARKAIKLGYTSAAVKMKGIGNNKQYAVQSLSAAGLQLTQLKDVTAIPYNGCRRPKKRRV